MQLGRRLRGKVEPSDLVQEAFLEAHRDFDAFRGTISAELLSWLRRVLVHNLANQVRRFQGTRRRDVRLQRELAAELKQSSQALARGLAMAHPSPSHLAEDRERSVRRARSRSPIENGTGATLPAVKGTSLGGGPPPGLIAHGRRTGPHSP